MPKAQKTPPPRLYGPFDSGKSVAVYDTGHVAMFDHTGIQDVRLSDAQGNHIDKLPCVPQGDVVVNLGIMLWADDKGRLHALDKSGRYSVTKHTLPTAEEVQATVANREAALIDAQRRKAAAEAEEANRRAAQAESEAARWKQEAERRAELAEQLEAEKAVAETGVGATDARRRSLELIERIQSR